MSDTVSHLEQLATRAVTLYSRPTVAMDLLRLVEQPAVDAQAIKNCVAQDPAMVSKVLRVVNSSLYGLTRPVSDLNQAIGILGMKPLKLLVLGFSLPDELFADVAARELRWYWTNTLTRAVAARLLCEKLWRQPGDEVFVAGLLQDIGILVLLRELGAPYARFLSGIINENCLLAPLEHETLGFDHVQLSAAVLRHWQLPERLVQAVEMPKRTARLERLPVVEGALPQILHLAEMLMLLVGQRRLAILPELIEAGKLYRGMTKANLVELVEGLQSQVDQLGEALSLDLERERNYVEVLVEAQHQLSLLGEQIASESTALDEDDEIYAQLLAHTGELTDAMRAFLAGKRWAERQSGGQLQSHAAHGKQGESRGFVGCRDREPVDRVALLQNLITAATRAREKRQELSLLLAESSRPGAEATIVSDPDHRLCARSLERACQLLHQDRTQLVRLTDGRAAAILINCERNAAIGVAHQAIVEFANHAAEEVSGADDFALSLGVGVATVGVVPKNFDPSRLLESALRCLAAARAGGCSAVKSIEV